MFVSREEITRSTGLSVTQQTLQLAQLMIEAWVGKDEAEVSAASDFSILGKAVLFQALYLSDENATDMLQQAAVTSMTVGETRTSFDKDLFAPYMSPWAIKTCMRLSFVGSRSVTTGPWNDVSRPVKSWVTD